MNLFSDMQSKTISLLFIISLLVLSACGDITEEERVSESRETHQVISLKTIGEENDVRKYRIPIDDLWKTQLGECLSECITIRRKIEGYDYIYGIGKENRNKRLHIKIANYKREKKNKLIGRYVFIKKTPSNLSWYKHPRCPRSFKYTLNTPLSEIKANCPSFSRLEDYISPELGDGRVLKIACYKNCTVETAYKGISVQYTYSRTHLENWRDIDAKVFAVLDSYTKPFNVENRESNNGVH